RTATMIPFQAILMPFHNHLAPATMPFQTACMIGHTYSMNQFATASAAALMPAQAALTMSRNQPTFLYAIIKAPTRRTRPAIIRQLGLAVNTALRAACAVAIPLVIAIRAAPKIRCRCSIRYAAHDNPLLITRTAFQATTAPTIAAIIGAQSLRTSQVPLAAFVTDSKMP